MENKVLIRLIGHSRVVELRSLTMGSVDDEREEEDGQVLRLSFGSRILPLPRKSTFTHPSTGTTTIILISRRAEIHRIDLPRGIASYAEAETVTSKVRGLEGVDGWEVVSETDLVVWSAAGGIGRCMWDHDGELVRG
jgi:hypothetical protein